MNTIKLYSVINLLEPLFNVYLKNIILVAYYKNSKDVQGSRCRTTDIGGTGINNTITIRDFLKGIFSMKKFLQYQKAEHISINHIKYFKNTIICDVIFSTTCKSLLINHYL